jgi:hypothetical protein
LLYKLVFFKYKRAQRLEKRRAMNSYWEEDLNPALVNKYQIDPQEVVSYKKCVDRGLGRIWFEVLLKDNTIKTFALAGH